MSATRFSIRHKLGSPLDQQAALDGRGPADLAGFAAFKAPSQPRFSPDGAYLLYTLTEQDPEQNQSRQHLHLLDCKTRESRQLTANASALAAIWLDAYQVFFLSPERQERDQKPRETCLYRIDCRGGEARHALTFDKQVKRVEILDARHLILAVAEADEDEVLGSLRGEQRQLAEAALEENQDYEVIEAIPFWHNGGTFAHRYTRLYLCTLPEGAELTSVEGLAEGLSYQALTSPDQNVGDWCFEARQQKLFYLATQRRRVMPLHQQLYCLDLLEKTPREAFRAQEWKPFGDEPMVYWDLYTTEDATYVWATNMQRYGLNQDALPYRVLPDRAQALLAMDPDDPSEVNQLRMGGGASSDLRQGGGKHWLVHQGRVHMLATWQDHAAWRSFPLQDEPVHEQNIQTHLAQEGCNIESLAVFENRWAYMAFTPGRGVDLYLSEGDLPQRPTAENRIGDWGGAWSKEKLATVSSFLFSTPYREARAYVVLPPDYVANKKYPALLSIHGGPKATYGALLYHEMQYLAQHGYIVFYTNPLGSDGLGWKKADIRGRYGTVDYEELMALTDAVLSKYPAIDPQRLGVFGGSYGGFMSNWIIGHTQRFAACVTQRSIANWISMYGISDIGYYFVEDQIAGNPYDQAKELWAVSPLAYARQMKTPTLIIHSDEDYRCPIAEGYQLYAALELQGVPTRLVVFHGENHELSRSGKPRHRMRRLEEIHQWFDRYLKSDTTQKTAR